MPVLYLRLEYEEYKKLEETLERWENIETTHKTEGFYHKSLRLPLGSLTLEIHGPFVQAAYPEGPAA